MTALGCARVTRPATESVMHNLIAAFSAKTHPNKYLLALSSSGSLTAHQHEVAPWAPREEAQDERCRPILAAVTNGGPRPTLRCALARRLREGASVEGRSEHRRP